MLRQQVNVRPAVSHRVSVSELQKLLYDPASLQEQRRVALELLSRPIVGNSISHAVLTNYELRMLGLPIDGEINTFLSSINH